MIDDYLFIMNYIFNPEFTIISKITIDDYITMDKNSIQQLEILHNDNESFLKKYEMIKNNIPNLKVLKMNKRHNDFIIDDTYYSTTFFDEFNLLLPQTFNNLDIIKHKYYYNDDEAIKLHYNKCWFFPNHLEELLISIKSHEIFSLLSILNLPSSLKKLNLYLQTKYLCSFSIDKIKSQIKLPYMCELTVELCRDDDMMYV